MPRAWAMLFLNVERSVKLRINLSGKAFSAVRAACENEEVNLSLVLSFFLENTFHEKRGHFFFVLICGSGLDIR